jgi:hypothetical protein
VASKCDFLHCRVVFFRARIFLRLIGMHLAAFRDSFGDAFWHPSVLGRLRSKPRFETNDSLFVSALGGNRF